MMISYKTRIDFIENILNTFSKDSHVRFKILSLFHYTLVFTMYAIIFLSSNFPLFLLAMTFFLLQFIFNIIDRGCFMLKLERKYKGKEWIGPYIILKKIYPELTIQNIMVFYRIVSFIFMVYVFYRFYGFYTNLKQY